MIHDYPCAEIWQNGGANNEEPSLQDIFFTVSVCLLTNHLTEDESNVMSLVERSIDVKNSVLVIGTPMLRKDLKWPGFKSIPLKTPK